MAKKKPGTPKRWRTKEAREVVSAVKAAGGQVELTSDGHLRITGPDGEAIVASAPGAGRVLTMTYATIRRETGLEVGVADSKPSNGGKPAPERRAAAPQPSQPRHGELTRWGPGHTSGFITDDDGTSWFVSRDSLPRGLDELPEGTLVAFSGKPTPKAGKAYPEAQRIRIQDRSGIPETSQ
jgi:hypothetical protein